MLVQRNPNLVKTGSHGRRLGSGISLGARAGLAALTVMPLLAGAAGTASAQATTWYPYKLIDVGTFGGPQAGQGNGPYVNADGIVAGTADTATADPYAPNDNPSFNGDPLVQHAFSWRGGILTDLGALGPKASSNSSYPNGITALGDAAGVSDNGTLDPLTGTTETRAVLWKNGEIMNLGTLGGNESQAFALNNQDEVVGVAANATPDSYSMLSAGTQARAFLWHNGRMRDLGTLGGPDSFGWFINAQGQVAGVSYTSAIPNPVTGQPPASVFLWQNGAMRDLGNLGGSVPTFGGVVAFNSSGEIAGQSDLPGDQIAHPFLWNGTRMIDLGTLGGANGNAAAINSVGTVVGTADLAGQTHHAFVWQNGRMRDLPPIGGAPCSNALAINDTGEVVGNTTDCQGQALTAVMWAHGSAFDLNNLIAPSPLHLTEPVAVNNAGDIIGYGVLPNGEQHNFLLVPNNRR